MSYYLFKPGEIMHEVEDVPMPNEVPAGTYLGDVHTRRNGLNWYMAARSIEDNYQPWRTVSDPEQIALLNTQLLLIR